MDITIITGEKASQQARKMAAGKKALFLLGEQLTNKDFYETLTVETEVVVVEEVYEGNLKQFEVLERFKRDKGILLRKAYEKEPYLFQPKDLIIVANTDLKYYFPTERKIYT